MKSKKKILYLITGLEIGGAEKNLASILPFLKSNFIIEVCCLRGRGILGEEITNHGIPVHYLNLTIPNLPRTIHMFHQIIKTVQPDLLITYLIHSDLFGRIFGRLFGVKKIICNRRGFYLTWPSLRIIDRLTAPLATHYIVQTQVAKKALIKTLGLQKEKVTVIPNSVDLGTYNFPLDKEAKQAALRIPRGNLNIVCVSTLKAGKGHEELLAAFEKMYAIHPNINLLLVGDGEKKPSLLEQIKHYTSRNHIFFLGQRQDIKEILRISDIFILPTHSEGMSNAILEAMASHLPIITTNIPVNEEIIMDGKTGILITTEDSEAIWNALSLLIDNSDIRERLGDNAYQKAAESFAMDKNIALTNHAYEQVLYVR